MTTFEESELYAYVRPLTDEEIKVLSTTKFTKFINYGFNNYTKYEISSLPTKVSGIVTTNKAYKITSSSITIRDIFEFINGVTFSFFIKIDSYKANDGWVDIL